MSLAGARSEKAGVWPLWPGEVGIGGACTPDPPDTPPLQFQVGMLLSFLQPEH